MGMITRVRGRLRSLHTLPKLRPHERDEKIAQTVCLLSVLFLLPYCSKGHSPLLLKLGGVWLVTYSCLVLPLLISANYKYQAKWLKMIFKNLLSFSKKLSGPASSLLLKIYEPIEKCENAFMKMTNLSNMATQLVFFMMCDRVLLSTTVSPYRQERQLTGLYTLMFYNVVAYCVSYIKELIEKEDWSPYVNMTQNGNLKHVAMSATKIVLEWTKAVTFIITVTFMLLVLALERGLDHYQPTRLYTFVTWSYYMCTEKTFVQFGPVLLTSMRIRRFEALESLYASVIVRCYTIAIASALAVLLLLFGQFRMAFLSSYLTVHLKLAHLRRGSLAQLKKERATLDQFRVASQEEINDWDDVCAVCLCPLRAARVTPCQHLFHADCLRMCLNTSSNCPICKREYTFLF